MLMATEPEHNAFKPTINQGGTPVCSRTGQIH